MYPKAYFTQLQSKGMRNSLNHKWLLLFLPLITLPPVVLIISPIFHELSHILLLNFFNQYYRFQMRFDLISGIYGNIKIYTPINIYQSIIVVLSGIITSFFLYLFLSMLSKMIKEKLSISLLLNFLSIGFLVDLTIGLFKGDINTALQILGLNNNCLVLVNSLLIMLFLTFRSLKNLLELNACINKTFQNQLNS